jgi:cytoskeletal protein CcmA (bactofilin family)
MKKEGPAGAEVPVLHSAIDLPPASVNAAAHRFAAWLVEAETLVIPADACLRGNFSAPCVHVKGVVHGKLTATRGPMVIDRGARVHGRVDASGTLVIAGHVLGRGGGPAVLARGDLHLASTARVSGAVRCVEVAIYEGARVAGSLGPLSR